MGLPLLAHSFVLRLGSRMDKFVVFRDIGGLSPSMSLVTAMSKSQASPTSQITVLRKLEEAASERSNSGDSSVVSGRSSLSSQLFVSLVSMFWKVTSTKNLMYLRDVSKAGTSVVFRINMQNLSDIYISSYILVQVRLERRGFICWFAASLIMPGILGTKIFYTCFITRLSNPLPVIFTSTFFISTQISLICTSNPKDFGHLGLSNIIWVSASSWVI